MLGLPVYQVTICKLGVDLRQDHTILDASFLTFDKETTTVPPISRAGDVS